MRKRLRGFAVAVLAGVVLVTSAGTALGAQATDAAPNADVLDTVKAETLEWIEAKIDRFQARFEELEGRDGVLAQQLAALAADGIAIYEQLAADVESADTVGEILQATRAANQEYRAHRRVRVFYAHVQGDINKFTRRLNRLENAIDRAEQAGSDVAAAVAEAEAAAAGLVDAQAALDAIDPSQTGPEVMEALREAHRTAHGAQRHILAGWRALREAIAA